MAAATLSSTRALRPPRRLDARAVFGVAIAALAIFGSIAFWGATNDSRAVLVAARDLPTGATIEPADLKVVRVRVDDSMYAAALPGDALTTTVGKQLNEPLHAHQLLARAQLSARPALAPQEMALTIPVSAETAAGGRIQPGDWVQVLVTTAKGRPESQTFVVLPRGRVFDVGRDERLTVVNTASATDSSASGGSESGRARGAVASVTLALTQEQAVGLARARWNGELDVALLPPDVAARQG